MNAEATALRDAKRIDRAIPGRWSGPPSDAAVRAATKLMLVPLRLLATPMGRRLTATVVLSVVLVAVVSSLYEHADGPAVAVRQALNAVPAAASKPAAAKRTVDASQRTSATVTAPPAAKRPEDAATAWYAQREGVSPDRVHALQRQRVSATVIKVLVMAEVSATDMPTAFVNVKRDGEGWKVP